MTEGNNEEDYILCSRRVLGFKKKMKQIIFFVIEEF